MKSRKKAQNVFYDNRGFPDETNAYDNLLHNVDGGVVLRKKKFDAPPWTRMILVSTTPSTNRNMANDYAKSSIFPICPKQGDQLSALIKRYWSIFDNRGTFTPVRHYQFIIDTGSASLIAVKKIDYGPQETKIMQRSINALEKVGQISQIHDGQWLFKALLAPKPHQEHISDIADFVWRFCVNYIPLNQVTWQIAYPIPRCDNAVETAFGGFWIWLYDAIMGYHQLSVSKEL
jgi:hypothetical protein